MNTTTQPTATPASRKLAARTDVHCPSRLVPEDYEYVAMDHVKIEGLGDCFYAQAQREIIKAHMARTGGTYSRHEHGGTCGVCGSVNAVYTALFYHAKSNTYVRTGQECAALIDSGSVPHFNQLRKAAADAREFQKGKAKARAILADAGLVTVWDLVADYDAKVGELCAAAAHEDTRGPATRAVDDYRVAHREEGILSDMVAKLVKYGSASEKQIAFMGKLVADIPLRAERAAKRAAEAEAAAPCPAGRVTVSGEVVSVRVDDGGLYGPVTKMLVKANEGYKVWSTMPAGANANRGDRITFKATVTPSDTDPKFGFGKRPTLVSHEPKAEPVPA